MNTTFNASLPLIPADRSVREQQQTGCRRRPAPAHA